MKKNEPRLAKKSFFQLAPEVLPPVVAEVDLFCAEIILLESTIEPGERRQRSGDQGVGVIALLLQHLRKRHASTVEFVPAQGAEPMSEGIIPSQHTGDAGRGRTCGRSCLTKGRAAGHK